MQIGQAETTQVLELIEAMTEEDDYSVWSNIVSCLEKIDRLLADTEIRDLFVLYGRKILKPIYNKLGYEKSANEGLDGKTARFVFVIGR